MIGRWQTLFVLFATILPMVGCKTWNPTATSGSQEAPLAVSVAKNEVSPKVKACLVTAQTLHQEGHYRESALLLERARAEAPNAHDYSRQLAVLYDELGISDKAEHEFILALAKTPNDADLHNDFGFFYLQRSDHVRAEQQFRKALQIAPEHQRAKSNLARSLFKQNRLEEAYATYEQAVGAANAHHNMGVLFSQAGRDHEARMAFQEAIAADPKLDMSREFLASLDNLPEIANRQRTRSSGGNQLR
ncbi:tetratricopeptide repeat protein [Bremerella sp. P1]|uniref:tetratricopeptide repeat protein n=1 Tax=Bremerella sp. P1 TaxID=3026424 RepID=UPI00236746B0|nr:tetratricopeptide repeat protein [Bremerella sp. P1]WDI42520.1 tetratricopeptide repeat protein [Bremerella sp. P1]